ncbi:MAG: ABC transporter permease [Planctomycetaceae bacterium]|nr:MAG: ABC transporter permease [Planctomycetaceae bacterium]
MWSREPRLFSGRWCVLTLIGIICWSGCQRSAPEMVSSPPEVVQPRQRVRLLLNWFPEVEHGGYYAALVHGYFAEEGLEVTIEPGGPKSPVLAQVAADPRLFAVDNADKLLLARAQQADLVALFAPIQHSPRCLLMHASSPLRTFEDLETVSGGTLAINEGLPFAQFLKRRFNLERWQIIPYPGNLSQFLLNPQMVVQAYNFSEPWLARQQGVEVRYLMLSDLGFDPYTSCLIASSQLLREEPELANRMVRACQRGWQTYLADPSDTHQHLQQLNPELSAEALQAGWEALFPLCIDLRAKLIQVGQMTPERWQTLYTQMLASGSLPPDEQILTQAFTTTYLDTPLKPDVSDEIVPSEPQEAGPLLPE